MTKEQFKKADMVFTIGQVSLFDGYITNRVTNDITIYKVISIIELANNPDKTMVILQNVVTGDTLEIQFYYSAFDGFIERSFASYDEADQFIKNKFNSYIADVKSAIDRLEHEKLDLMKKYEKTQSHIAELFAEVAVLKDLRNRRGIARPYPNHFIK